MIKQDPPAVRPVNRLRFIFETVGPNTPQLRPQVDGHDLLSDYRYRQGLDPERLLPPLSAVLLPTRAGRVVLIGVCSCGHTGCGSLAMLVRRVGAEVVWGAVADPRHESIARRYRFALVDYLEALDNAAEDRPGEGQGRRVARLVNVMLRQYDDQFEEVPLFDEARIDWPRASQWTSPTVRAGVSGPAGQRVLEFNPGPRESERHFAARVVTEVDKARRECFDTP